MKKPKELLKSRRFWMWSGIGVVTLALLLALIISLVSGGEDVPEVNDDSGVTSESETQESSSTETVESTEPTQTGSDVSQEATPTESEIVPTEPEGSPYEDWLAAAMVIGISMQYPDFEFEGIYTASETWGDDHSSSQGSYVLFRSNGEQILLRALPLEEERTEHGTKDLYVPALGYATFDVVPVDSVDLGTLKERSFEELTELISASSLVSIAER